MKSRLTQDLDIRIHQEISNSNPLKYLKEHSSREYFNKVVEILYLYTRDNKTKHDKQVIYMTQVVAAIGHAVRAQLRQKVDSGLATKTGAFILYSFEQEGILEVVLGKGKRKHNCYQVQIHNDEAIMELWAEIPNREIEKLPSEEPYSPWRGSIHSNGKKLVKTNDKRVLRSLHPDTHPMVFDCVNKAQRIGWKINPFIYNLSSWALRNKTDAFADIWEQQDKEAKATKLREARAIGDIAKRFMGKVFYHLYYYDFRGRKYPSTAYLHEQGSDFARGLLLRRDSKAIGKKGFFWLMVSLANNWAGDAGREDELKTDKIPLQDRYAWSMDNEEILISYAENPKVNQGWMKADKPWQFLAACHELKCFRDWQSESMAPQLYLYHSHLECFIDG